ncbi:alpha/beta hydrolase [Rhizorhabdus dicambivorans]|uniref:Alpha/beta hydrolase n=1 Tax=Rhizorhabdus dicambivorans TaxID=1850238 RepID=A0A2A4FQW4_9SPHN|nr:alpha/beta hydrolase [Rhizorhabdus dicambivorans]ATE64675.1 alpha/beta hydrolase [Rhizorhabdus dicambivorans]PCE39791.1 alpha/beta hydrolase [Rhizorhabdus dicambivorans]
MPEGLRFIHETLMRMADGIGGHEHRYGDDPSQSLIVYPAARPNGPVLLFLHGGGWTNGYKEEMAFLAPPFNAAGVTLVSAGYRLAPRHVFPSNFNDVADAVAMAWRLAEVHGHNRDALFVGGHSAGGHLASLLATRDDWQAPRGLPGNVIRGCLPISGSYDFTPGAGSSVRPRFLGPPGLFNEVAASPIFQLSDRAAPFLIAHGSDDLPHLKVQSEKFALVARAKGVPVEALEVDGVNHATILLTAADPDKPWLAAAVAWMRTRLDGH